jgi:hypothetical protein
MKAKQRRIYCLPSTTSTRNLWRNPSYVRSAKAAPTLADENTNSLPAGTIKSRFRFDIFPLARPLYLIVVS